MSRNLRAVRMRAFPFKPGGSSKGVVVLSCGPTPTCVLEAVGRGVVPATTGSGA